MNCQKLGIVVPVINCLEYTKGMFDSIKSQRDWSLFIIDNGSTDMTPTYCEELKKQNANVNFLRNEANLGVGASWNVGIRFFLKQPDTDLVLVINNDIIFHPHCIDALMKRFEQGDIVMSTAVDIRGEVVVPQEVLSLPDKLYSEDENGLHFSCFMLSREGFEKVGYFDEGFKRGYFEDNDFHYRMKLAGVKGVAITSALFYHYGSRTQNQVGIPGGIVPSELFLANRDYYIKKWGGEPGRETYKTPFNQ